MQIWIWTVYSLQPANRAHSKFPNLLNNGNSKYTVLRRKASLSLSLCIPPPAAMARRRTRVPEVLLRLFGDNARTLADTILALIPPRPATATGCRCKGRRCLSCSGDEAMSFLVRPGDPSDYRKLLTGCFAVVSENAPPLPVFDPHCRWPQREVCTMCARLTWVRRVLLVCPFSSFWRESRKKGTSFSLLCFFFGGKNLQWYDSSGLWCHENLSS